MHNTRSAPVICPTTVCTVSQVKMYCKRGNSNCEHLNMITNSMRSFLYYTIGIQVQYFTYTYCTLRGRIKGTASAAFVIQNRFLTGPCCMTDGKARAAEPSLYQGLASSPAREATRRATRHFCKLFQPAREIGRTLAQFLNGTVLYDGRQGEGGRTFAFPRFGELSSA